VGINVSEEFQRPYKINHKKKEVWEDLQNDGKVLFCNILTDVNMFNNGKDKDYIISIFMVQVTWR
jgi:hypothetical protein